MSHEVIIKLKSATRANIVEVMVNDVLLDKFTQVPAFRLREVGTGETFYLIHVDGLKVEDLLGLFSSVNSRKRDFKVMSDNDMTIEYTQPNFVFRKLDSPNDPQFMDQWGLLDSAPGRGGISAVSAWRTSKGSEKIVVGVVDSGVQFDHPDLDNNMWDALMDFKVTVAGQEIRCHRNDHGFNAPANNCVSTDQNYHGTHVAGIIGAEGNNNMGLAGVNWTTSVMDLRYIDDYGNTNEEDIVNAISFAVEVKKQKNLANIRVLNNSYGYQTTWDSICRPNSLAEAIWKANDEDILFVAAAGDEGASNDDVPFFPANLNIPNVISVAATTRDDRIVRRYNYGVKTVHIGAPGASIISTRPRNRYDFGSGTSFAAPFVTGAAALILSVHPDLTTAALKKCILDSADRVPALERYLPNGRRLNVSAAIEECGKPSGFRNRNQQVGARVMN